MGRGKLVTGGPTIGHTVAVGKFNPNGPTGYRAFYSSGRMGPLRKTRMEAEADYKRNEAARRRRQNKQKK